MSRCRPCGSRCGTLARRRRASSRRSPARVCSRLRATSELPPVVPKDFTEPRGAFSTRPDDLPLPRTASGLSFDLLALPCSVRAATYAPKAGGSREFGTLFPHFATFLDPSL